MFLLGLTQLHVRVLENLGLTVIKRIDGSMSCEIQEFVKSHDFWKMCSGCFESPCHAFIELDILLEWTHWNVALEIQMMETMYE